MSTAARRALEAAGCDALLASDPATVAWISGFAPDITSGPAVFAAPPIALVRDDGSVVLFVSEDEAPGAEGLGCEVVAYEGFTVGPLDARARQAEALATVALPARVGVEAQTLSLALARALGEARILDAAPALAGARAVKSPEELEHIRASIRLCDAGQAAAREHAQPGMSELELWAHIVEAMEAAAGERLPLLADLVGGDRTAEIGGPPSDRVLAEGELVLCDLVPRLGAWWGDSCATFALGEPPPGAREAHARAREALDRALSELKPGVRAGDLHARTSAGLDYPHHTGHGLGTAYHEEPRIVPDGPTVLEAGMVVALEPGTYPGPWGLRVEQIAVVTDDGCEILSGHSLEL